MKAAVFYGPNQPLRVEEYPTPEPRKGEVLVKIAGCGVCHTDIGYIDHGVPTFKKPPMILGHEASGTIAKLGEGVKNLQVGDKVLLGVLPSCGYCDNCRDGRENVCQNQQMIGNSIDGAYAEYIATSSKAVFPMPDEIPLIESSILADALTTPFHAVVNRAKLKAGEKVAVFGCGGVGINTIQMANAVGGSVIAVDLGRGQPITPGGTETKLDMARKLGATETIAKNEENPVKKIKKLTGGGVDVAFEVIGNPKTINMAYNSVKQGGRLVVVGFSPKKVELNLGKLMFRELSIIGSMGARNVDYPRLIELTRLGKINVKDVVTGIYPIEKINEAMDVLRSGQALRLVVTP